MLGPTRNSTLCPSFFGNHSIVSPTSINATSMLYESSSVNSISIVSAAVIFETTTKFININNVIKILIKGLFQTH